MFCPNCGAQIPDDSIFCDKCGCRVGGGISEQRNHADSTSFPDERKSGSSKAAKYIVVAVVIAAVVGAGVFFLWKAGVLGSGTALKPELSVTATELAPESEKLPEETTTPATVDSPTEAHTEDATEKPTEAPTEEVQDPETHDDTEQTAETGTESKAETSGESVEGPVEEPAPLPYADTLGNPAATDFAWITDVQTGDLTGRFLSNDELVGKWKGEIIYDAGIWELVSITIYTDGKITIEPYQINYGEGWDDETDGEPYLFNGEFDVSGINAAGSFGSISLYTFLESYGTQYGVGTFTVNNSNSAKVYMVRP